MTAHPTGRSLVTKRALRDLVRSAVLSVYGVSGFAGGRAAGRLLGKIGLAHPGLKLRLGDTLDLELNLTVAYGLPVAEVARQVEAAVRYTLRHALDREPDTISIRIGRLRHEHGLAPVAPAQPQPDEPDTNELAASGTDVA